MIAPIPSAIRPQAPNVLLRVWVPDSCASDNKAAIGFLTNKLINVVDCGLEFSTYKDEVGKIVISAICQ